MLRLLLACVVMLPVPAHARGQTVRIGVARSVSNGAELIAVEKRYFREHNIKVEIGLLDSSANAIALLARGGLDMIAGGMPPMFAGLRIALAASFIVRVAAELVASKVGIVVIGIIGLVSWALLQEIERRCIPGKR